MKTLIEWLKRHLQRDCRICDDALYKLENLPKGMTSFILTIDKNCHTEFHLGIHPADR